MQQGARKFVDYVSFVSIRLQHVLDWFVSKCVVAGMSTIKFGAMVLYRKTVIGLRMGGQLLP